MGLSQQDTPCQPWRNQWGTAESYLHHAGTASMWTVLLLKWEGRGNREERKRGEKGEREKEREGGKGKQRCAQFCEEKERERKKENGRDFLLKGALYKMTLGCWASPTSLLQG